MVSFDPGALKGYCIAERPYLFNGFSIEFNDHVALLHACLFSRRVFGYLSDQNSFLVLDPERFRQFRASDPE